MTVTIVCFGAMREYLPPGATGNRGEVSVREGASVGDVVDALGAPRSLVFSILVDGVQATLDDEVASGAEITLMPPFAGGAILDPAFKSRATAPERSRQCRRPQPADHES
ncbi:MAG TPA: MoaD/ThiS family protein [Actinomycetota bacterium]|nr:MoaD/ThiS family protein [Actinomycetota bacterium]